MDYGSPSKGKALGEGMTPSHDGCIPLSSLFRGQYPLDRLKILRRSLLFLARNAQVGIHVGIFLDIISSQVDKRGMFDE